jgi:hypothetical protein
MKKTLIALTSLTLLLASCRKDVSTNPSTGNTTVANTTSSPRLVFNGNGAGLGRMPAGYEAPTCIVPVETSMMAGQSTNTGTVTVWNDDTNVYVAYQLDGDYQLKKTHLYVGSCNSIPVNNAGNPRIGNYPYHTDHAANVSTYVYVIPKASLPAGCLCVSAHAEVVAYGTNGSLTFSQTGWGNGSQINDGGSWAMKFGYCVQECDSEPR